QKMVKELLIGIKFPADVDLEWREEDYLPVALIMFNGFDVSVKYSYHWETEDVSFSHLCNCNNVKETLMELKNKKERHLIRSKEQDSGLVLVESCMTTRQFR